MPLHSLTVNVSPEVDSGFVSDVLFELGALSVSVTDRCRGTAEEESIYGGPPQVGILDSSSSPREIWQNAQVNALFPLSANIEALVMTIATDFNLPQTPTFKIQSELFDEKDPETWVKEVQESFQPIQLGDAWIMFPWHEAKPGALNVQLEPGLAFGTGEHATTQLCVRWLQRSMRPGTTLLDYGTGSGVLCIFGVLLAEKVTGCGVDLDPEAIPVAWANARRNGVEDKVEFYVNEEEPLGRSYDYVVANIMATPLKNLADTLVDRLKPGGMIAMSGVLVNQATDVMEWYQQRGIAMENASTDSGWVLLVGVKSDL